MTGPSVVDGISSGALGAGVSGFLPTTRPLSVIIPELSYTLALTSEPGCILIRRNHRFPAGSTVTSGLSEVQLLSSPFVKIVIFCVPALSV